MLWARRKYRSLKRRKIASESGSPPSFAGEAIKVTKHTTRETPMNETRTLSHSKYECKHHLVFRPKYRKKTLYLELRKHLGEVFKEFAKHRESEISEGHLMPDHVHMMISIPPKYAVSQVVGYIKGKSAIHLARVYIGKKRNFVGQSFWARGYYVSTVDRDEQVFREYIRN